MAESLFGTPPTISNPDNAEDTYSMSTRIEFLAAGTITGVRFWGTTNNIATSPVARVYTTAGVAESTEAFVGPFLTTAWNTVMLGTPVAVAAGEFRDITVGPRNRYAANLGQFAAPLTVGNLRGHAGRFIVSAASPPPFPTTSTTTWYGVDVLFEPDVITGTLDVTLPEATAAAAGEVTVTGTLDVELPAATVEFTGTVTALPVTSIIVPFRFFVAVTGVSACIVDELEAGLAQGLPTLGEPGRVVPLVPGSEIPWDGCECGQLAQAVEHGPYPSNFAFPVEDNGVFGNCRLDGLAIRVRASLIRCEYHPCPDEQAHPPSAAAQLSAGQMQQIDEYLMRKAITCCLAAMRSSRLIDDYAMGASDYAVNGCCGEVSMLYWVHLV